MKIGQRRKLGSPGLEFSSKFSLYGPWSVGLAPWASVSSSSIVRAINVKVFFFSRQSDGA